MNESSSKSNDSLVDSPICNNKQEEMQQMEELDVLKEELKFWKGQLQTGNAPPLFIDILLDISALKPGTRIVLCDPRTGRRRRISQDSLVGFDLSGNAVKKQKILLETWQLALSSTSSMDQNQPDLPTVYKKCIVFFRSLYSFVRLMPSFKFCKKMASKSSAVKPCKIVYRVGSSRTNSPLDAGLDQVHVLSDMRHAMTETDFPSIETPLGVLTLHTAYRLDCDFSIEEGNVAMDGLADLEPHFFTPSSLQQQQRQQQQQTQGVVVDRSALMPKQAVFIPNSNWRDTHTTSGGTAPSSTGSHFTPFTPPNPNPLKDRFLQDINKEAPPFSVTAPLPINTGHIKNMLGSASPPFALAQRVEEHIATQSLIVQRRPSYIFPGSPGTNNMIPYTSSSNPTTTSHAFPQPLLFTPTSSFVHSPHLAYAPTPGTDVETFLTAIEQAGALRITAAGETGKSAGLEGIGSSVVAQDALDRFRILQKENAEFINQVEMQMGGCVGGDSIYASNNTDDDRESSKEHDQDFSTTTQTKVPVPTPTAPLFGSLVREGRQSVSLGRRRTISTADMFPNSSSSASRSVLAFGTGVLGLARSESGRGQSQSEDDELLFNMSDIHHV